MASNLDVEAAEGWSMAQIVPGASDWKSWKFEQDIFSHSLATNKSLILILTTPQKIMNSEKLKQNSGILLLLKRILDL